MSPTPYSAIYFSIVLDNKPKYFGVKTIMKFMFISSFILYQNLVNQLDYFKIMREKNISSGVLCSTGFCGRHSFLKLLSRKRLYDVIHKFGSIISHWDVLDHVVDFQSVISELQPNL